MFIIEIPGLPRLEAGLAAEPRVQEAETARVMQRSVLIVEREVKHRTPVRTRRLFSAWTPEVISLSSGRVFNTVKYGPYVEHGTGPHLIRPVNAQALSWPGAQHPVRVVHHPGTRGRHMAEEGARAAEPLVQEQFKLAADRALETVKA